MTTLFSKKLSAIFIAGTIVFGGVAISGLNSYAYTISENKEIQRVNSYCKNYGVVHVMENEAKLNESAKKYAHNKIANNGHLIVVKNPSEIPTQILNAKRYKKEVLKVKCHNLYYLIEVK